MLPPFDKWKEYTFDEVKQEIKEGYGIGSNNFSDAVSLIRNHRTMASRLGKEFDLLHLRDDKIKLVVEEWKKLHSQSNFDNLGTDFVNTDFEAMVETAKKDREVKKSLLQLLSEDEIADLETVFYIGRDDIFCEFYEQRLSFIKAKHRTSKDLAEQVKHLTEKMNFLDGIVKGLTILGKPALAKLLSN